MDEKRIDCIHWIKGLLVGDGGEEYGKGRWEETKMSRWDEPVVLSRQCEEHTGIPACSCGLYSIMEAYTLRNITDPRALALVLEQAEAKLAKEAHPDPYRRESIPRPQVMNLSDKIVAPMFPDGTKWYVSLSCILNEPRLTSCLGSVTFQ